MDFKKVMGLLPVVGAAFRDGETKSEYDLAMGAIATIAALPDIPGWARAVGMGIAVAAYIWARTSKKNAEASATKRPVAGPAAALLLALFLPVFLLGGCATYTRAVDTVSGVAKAAAASVEILKGPAEDVGKVWETAFPPAAEPAK